MAHVFCVILACQIDVSSIIGVRWNAGALQKEEILIAVLSFLASILVLALSLRNDCYSLYRL